MTKQTISIVGILCCIATAVSAQDLTLGWNDFLGSPGDEISYAVTTDSAGNVYVAGKSSKSFGEPVRAFDPDQPEYLFDAFVVKLSPSGAILWNTFLGGSGDDEAHAVAVAADGSIYVAGTGGATWGAPIAPFDGFQLGFVARLSSDGELIWNTFLGSSTDSNYISGLALYGSDLFLAGFSYGSWGTPLRSFAGSDDGFVARMTADGALSWNTFLGGSGIDAFTGIAVSDAGDLYVDGLSGGSFGAPVNAYGGGFADVVVARYTPSGALTWHTFLGGSAFDAGADIAYDAADHSVVVACSSNGAWGTPIRAYSNDNDACVARLDSSGALLWNTFLGGTSSDNANGVALADDGSILVVGYSYATWGSPLLAYASAGDAFVAALDASGALVTETFLGGDSDQWAMDVSGGVTPYVVGFSTENWGQARRLYAGGSDGFVAKLGTPVLTACAPTPLGSCFVPAKSKFQVAGNTVVPKKNKLTWQWSKGGEVVAADLGNPLSTTPAYALCVYDQSAGVSSLALSAYFDGGGACGKKPCWKGSGEKGFAYKNKSGGGSFGITGAKLKPAKDGKSQVKLTAKGGFLSVLPFSDTKTFDQDTQVVVQLQTSSPNRCWTSSFGSGGTKSNDGTKFKAQTN